MNESPASITFKTVTSKGFDLMVTLRGENEEETLARTIKMIDELTKKGCTPHGQAPVVVEKVVEKVPPIPFQDLDRVIDDLPEVVKPNELSFSAEQLVGNVNEGKTYWKVKGGKFSKFGVTIWSEALEAAGFDVDKLNPMQTYDLTGYIATYVEKEGKPNKVIKLSK